VNNASAVARETLHQLAEKKLPPTPDNYTRTYYEIASPGTKPHDDGESTRNGKLWCQLISDLLRQWEAHTPGLTRARKREGLDHVLTAFSGASELLYSRLRGLVGSWSAVPRSTTEAPVDIIIPATSANTAASPDDLDTNAKTAAFVRELLANTLIIGVVERMGYPLELARDARELATMARAAHTAAAVTQLGARLKHLWVALEIRGDDQLEIQQCLLRLLNSLCGNVGDLVGDDSWLREQLKMIAMLTAGPIDRAALVMLERGLREVVFKQSTLKQSLDQARDALKNLVTTFIDRLGAIADSTGGYHDRMSGYATRIERAENLPELFDLVSQVMRDTRSVQTNIQRSRDDLLATRRQVDEHQSRIATLQKELVTVSDRLHEDQLTQLPNRRGLARAFEVEASRADRRELPLCLSVLDIDNFKLLNDTLGHQAGDLALVHLADVVRQSIRPSDVFARYGGEEFVVILPETTLDIAVKVMTRVQQELDRLTFLHDNGHVSITFSAGVAQRSHGEMQDDLFIRADRALYRAKQTGKNRIVVTEV